MEQEVSKDVYAFVEQLINLSKLTAEIFQTGNIALFTDMNKVVKEMHRLQNGSTEDALAAVDEDCQMIYSNFDMIIAVLRTTEEGIVDVGAQKAINKFLHNINSASLNIATAYGLV